MLDTLIGAGLGLGTAIYGGIKSSQAKKQAQANLANRPKYSALPEDQSEIDIAENMASQGMSDASRQAYLNQSNQGLSAGIAGITRGGGDANAIGSLYGGYNEGINKLAMYDDQARQQHLSTLMQTYSKRNAMRQANADKEFQFNKYAPWADRQQLLTQQGNAGQQLMMNGVGTFGKALSTLGGAFGSGGGNTPQMPANTGYGVGMGGGTASPVGIYGDSGYSAGNGLAPASGGLYDNGPVYI